MPPAPQFYVRHGAMGHVGRFVVEGPASLERGALVVIRSRRGEELGEVLGPCADDRPTASRVVGQATPEDRSRAEVAAADRARRLALCDEFFRDGEWPIQLIDVEPMLDDGRTVLLYLGPHRLDASGLAQSLRSSCGLDVVLEPVGLDEAEEEADPHDCGSCGSDGSCGSGGCGSGTDSGGCSGCTVKDLVRSRGGMGAG